MKTAECDKKTIDRKNTHNSTASTRNREKHTSAGGWVEGDPSLNICTPNPVLSSLPNLDILGLVCSTSNWDPTEGLAHSMSATIEW